MKKYLIWSLLSFCLFISCTSQHRTNDDIFIIPIADNISVFADLKCSHFIEHFEYIQLETNENCLIPDVFKALILKNHILVYSVNFCYVFDRKTGKFFQEIGKYGRGPNEYQSALIAFNHSDSLICSLGWNDNSMVFDLNGKFLGEFPLPSSVRGMESLIYIKIQLFKRLCSCWILSQCSWCRNKTAYYFQSKRRTNQSFSKPKCLSKA